MKFQYICKTPDGEYFFTSEKCSSVEEAQQYIGEENIVVEPYLPMVELMQNKTDQSYLDDVIVKMTVPAKEFFDKDIDLKKKFKNCGDKVEWYIDIFVFNSIKEELLKGKSFLEIYYKHKFKIDIKLNNVRKGLGLETKK